MTKKLMVIFVTLAILMVFFAMGMTQGKAVGEEKKATHEFIGDKKCGMCHKKDGTHPSWLETKHAKAWESLKEADRKNPECVACHSTGTDAKGVLLEGVQCEACHGAGGDYYKKSIMEDVKLAMANGLLIPDTTTCMKCHNDKVPEQFRPKNGYNFAEMMKTGVHAMPVKEEKK